MGEREKFCGVDCDVLEQFLGLIRDKYDLVDKANYFLEHGVGISSINSGITNTRDALSHLSTLLNNGSWTKEAQQEQLSNAAEHLRRAIAEPYEIAVSEMVGRVSELYNTYKETVLSRTDPRLSGAPNSVSVRASFLEVSRLRQEARASKARNLWDPEWEAGIKSSIAAVETLQDLQNTMEDYINRASGIADTKKSHRLHLWSLLSGVVLGVLGIVVAWLLWRFGPGG